MKPPAPLPPHAVPATEPWRAVVRGSTPLVLGAIAPWAIWGAAGQVAAAELAAASLASAAVFLHILGGFGIARERAWPAFAVCCGLTISLLAPGLSALVLIDAVGLARAEGSLASAAPVALLADDAAMQGMAPGSPEN